MTMLYKEQKLTKFVLHRHAVSFIIENIRHLQKFKTREFIFRRSNRQSAFYKIRAGRNFHAKLKTSFETPGYDTIALAIRRTFHFAFGEDS